MFRFSGTRFCHAPAHHGFTIQITHETTAPSAASNAIARPTRDAPLRGGKATTYEGGIRVPCVVSFPGEIAKASRNDTIVRSCDFYPSLLGLLGLKPQPGQSFDGVSILSAFKVGAYQPDKEGVRPVAKAARTGRAAAKKSE